MDVKALESLCVALNVKHNLNYAEKLTAVMNRLRYLNLLDVCSRCSGTGSYSYNSINGTVCFQCKGFKFTFPKTINQEYVNTASELTNRGRLIPYLEEVKKRSTINKARKSIDNLIWNSNISQEYVAIINQKANVDSELYAYRQKLTDISKPFYDKQHEYDVIESRYKLGKASKEELDDAANDLYDLYVSVRDEIKAVCNNYEKEKSL